MQDPSKEPAMFAMKEEQGFGLRLTISSVHSPTVLIKMVQSSAGAAAN